MPHSIYLIDFDSPQCRDFDSPQCRRNRGVWCHNLWLPVKVGNLFTASVSLKGHEQRQLLAWHDWWLCKHKNQMPQSSWSGLWEIQFSIQVIWGRPSRCIISRSYKAVWNQWNHYLHMKYERYEYFIACNVNIDCEIC